MLDFLSLKVTAIIKEGAGRMCVLGLYKSLLGRIMVGTPFTARKRWYPFSVRDLIHGLTRHSIRGVPHESRW